MKHGGISPNDVRPGSRPAHWQEIVHNDLKPDNVFLDALLESSPGYKRYPTPLVGDFGLASFQAEDDPMNPRNTRSGGTDGYKAPEQIDFKHTDPNIQKWVDQWKLSSHTNVWGIGAIMAELASKQTFQLGSESEYVREGRLIPGWRIGSPKQLGISEELHMAIQQCLRARPWERPTLEQLKTHIHQFVMSRSAAEDPMGVYMHKARHLEEQPKHKEFDVQYLEERYKIGFALDELDDAGREISQWDHSRSDTAQSPGRQEESRIADTSFAASGAGRSLTSQEVIDQERIRAEMEALTMQSPRRASLQRTPPPVAFGVGITQQATHASDRARPYETPNSVQAPSGGHPAPRLTRMARRFSPTRRSSRTQAAGVSRVRGTGYDIFSPSPSSRGGVGVQAYRSHQARSPYRTSPGRFRPLGPLRFSG